MQKTNGCPMRIVYLMVVFIYALSSTIVVADSQNNTSVEITVHNIYADTSFSDIYLYINGIESDYINNLKQLEEKSFPKYRKPLGIIKAGRYTFTAKWRDPFTRTLQSNSVTRDILPQNTTTVAIDIIMKPYHNLKVLAKNENKEDINAFLYIDGEYSASKLIKGNLTEFDPIKLGSGSHDVSMRWLDPISNKEYQKKKRIIVDGDESLFFIATKGMITAEPQNIEKPKNSSEIQNEMKPNQDIQKKSVNDILSLTALQLKDPPLQEDIPLDGSMREVEREDSGVLSIYLLMLLISIYFAFRR